MYLFVNMPPYFVNVLFVMQIRKYFLNQTFTVRQANNVMSIYFYFLLLFYYVFSLKGKWTQNINI